ncbi:MAG: hypothetical protein AB4426_33735 [Xenococcaceae cyanobacterium]
MPIKAQFFSDIARTKFGLHENNIASLLPERRKQVESYSSNLKQAGLQNKRSREAECQIHIQENVWEIYHLLKLQKTAVGFKKIQSLYLLKTGQVKTVSDLANIVGVHQVTMREWLKKYLKEGVSGLLSMPLSNGLPPMLKEIMLTGLKERLNNHQR